MPIIVDLRDDQGKTPKTLTELKGEFQDKDLLAFEMKLRKELQDKIKLIHEKYPHLKGMRIL